MMIPQTHVSVVFDTLAFDEPCPYCQHRGVSLEIGRGYVSTLGLCHPDRRFGRAFCKRCGNEIPAGQWSQNLRAFYREQRKSYRLTPWQRFSFWVFCLLLAALFIGFGLIHGYSSAS